MSDLADRIRAKRLALGWSAEKLASACAHAGMPELNRSVIANIESRRRKTVTLDEAVVLADLLGVSLQWLAAGTDAHVTLDHYMRGYRDGVEAARKAIETLKN